MRTKHKIQYVLWSIVVAIAMTRDDLRYEYDAYQMRTRESGMAAFDANEWLHRRWFPRKYAYEYTCPNCGGYPLSSAGGLCFNCGERFEYIRERPARPL